MTEDQTLETKETAPPEGQTTAPEGKSLMDGAKADDHHQDEFPENKDMSLDKNPEGKEGVTTVELPQGLEPELWDAEKGVLKTQDMIKAYQEQKDLALKHRQTISKGLKAPEKMDEYQLAFDGVVEKMELGDDVLGSMRKVAFENGLTQDQALNTFNQFLNEMVEQGKISAPKTQEQVDAEHTAFMDEQRDQFDNAKQFQEAQGTLATFAERSIARGQMSETEVDTFKAMVGASADNMKIGLKMLEMMGELSIPTVSEHVDGLPSDSQIAQDMKDEKYSTAELETIFAKRKQAGRPDRISSELF